MFKKKIKITPKMKKQMGAPTEVESMMEDKMAGEEKEPMKKKGKKCPTCGKAM
jgi:hypothetical protein